MVGRMDGDGYQNQVDSCMFLVRMHLSALTVPVQLASLQCSLHTSAVCMYMGQPGLHISLQDTK